MDDEQRVTPDEFIRLVRPMMERIAKRFGRKTAVRMFNDAVRKAGIDPLRVRCMLPEDIN